MRIPRRSLLALGAAASAPRIGQAQSRAETLRIVMGGVVNSLEPAAFGATREATAMSNYVYDRLLAFGRKRNGADWIFDFDAIRGELAESCEFQDEGRRILLRLRDATWHDGTPVTAEDVKWSLDRAVGANGMSKSQLATGSLTSPEQFRILDARTIEVTLERPDRLALPNLACYYAPIFNSRLARQHATAEDPWATAWLKENAAAGGAYIVESYRPGQQVVLRRNEAWKSGPLPFFRRVILQTVPETATRASLVGRGDADICIDLQTNDVIGLQQRGGLKVVSTPHPTGFTALIFNTRMPPFDNRLVRQAIAAALPYDDIFRASVQSRGAPLYGATWTGTPDSPAFPQALPFRTDLARARELIAESGQGGGFRTSLSFGVSNATFAEPAAALVQESLARIGIQVEIRKLPDPQMATLITEKRAPMLLELSAALFPSTEYFFRIFYNGEQRWNFSSWANPEIAALLPQARFETDPARYDAMAKRLVALAAAEAPMIPLWRPSQDAVMAPSIADYTFWYHRQVDVRDLRRT